MTRKEIYEAWTKLSLDVRRLGGIVVGPMDNITTDDLTEWAGSFNKVRGALAIAADETAQFLSEIIAKKDSE